MKKLNINELLEKASLYKKEKILWHHHYFTPKCKFNDSNKYQIILECDDKNESFYSEFNERPLKELKILEELFFKV